MNTHDTDTYLHHCAPLYYFITHLLYIYYTLSYLFLMVLISGQYSWQWEKVTFQLDEKSCVCVSVRERERETVLMLFLVRFLHIKDKTAETEAGFLSLSGCLLCKCLSSCLTNWIHTWGGGHSSAAMLSLSGSFWPPAETVTPAVTPQTWREGAALPPLLHSSAEETLEPPLGKDRR